MIIKESLSDIKEEYEKAHKLIDEESKNDPPTEPFRSHYAARDILNKVKANLTGILSNLDVGSESGVIFRAVLGYILKDIGKISIFTEELSNGELALTEAIKLLEDKKACPEVINVFVESLNQLGILWSNRNDSKKSKKYLDEADELYQTGKSASFEPLTLSDLFGTKDEVEKGKGMLLFEKNHTLTLYYIAQVYGYLGDLDKSAHYCHLTLKRQLEFNDYEPIDWALNAATLSQYYFPKNAFNQARHLLAAASYMLDNYENDVIDAETNETLKLDKIETHKHRSADVARCWAKYDIHILSSSKERLCSDRDDDDDQDLATSCDNKLVLAGTDQTDRFENMQLTIYENQVTDQFCLTFEDAKLVLLNALSWLNKSKEYYTKETEATEYSRIIQDISSLYKHLAFFEDDENNQCKLHKRSVDHLEDLDTLLNPTYYLVICREIWYELGLTYSKMLDVKLTQLEKFTMNERPSPHALNKINKLCEKSISKFQKFLESYKIAIGSVALPDKIEEAEMQPIFFAFFHIGRLYYKIISPDKKMQLTNTQNSLKYYNGFIHSCDKHENVGSHFKAELGVCREMAKLLPHKMNSIMQEITSSERAQ